MPTLRALECLVAVLDAGSITEAAARLHLSQPALSHQIGALERELGTPVLERLPRGVRATSAGRAIVADARAALLAADRVVRTGRAIGEGVEGTVRIACVETLTAGLLAPVLRAWHVERPGVLLTLTEATSADALAEAVEAGDADIAVGPRPSRWTGKTTLVGREQVLIALAADDPRCARPTMTFAEFAAKPVVHYHPDNGLAGWIDRAAANHGVTLTAATRTRHASTAAELAAAGLGAALVPAGAITSSFAGALRRLRPELRRDVVILTSAGADSLVRRFCRDIGDRGIALAASLAGKLS